MPAGADPVSMAIQAAISLAQGLATDAAYRRQATRYDENARLSLLQGALDETAIRRQERAVSGEAIVAQADAGVAIGSGSALDLLQQSAVNREMAVLNARYGAANQAYGYRVKAADARVAGKLAITGSLNGIGTQILTETRSNAREDRLLQAQRDYPGGMQLPGTGPSYGSSTANVYAPRSVFPD